MTEKTKRVAARLTPLDVEKISRYFSQPTIRNFIESTLELAENNKEFRNKLQEIIKENKEISRTIVKPMT